MSKGLIWQFFSRLWLQHRAEKFIQFPLQMRLALCKIAHFMLSQIFSEWQPIDSTQQEAFLGAVGIAELQQWDSLTTQCVMKWLLNQAHCLVHFPSSSLSVSLLLALSAEYSTSTESFPCSQHRRADAGWKTFLFFFISVRKLALVSGIGRNRASKAFLYWEQVQYVSARSQHFYFARHKDAPQHSFSQF